MSFGVVAASYLTFTNPGTGSPYADLVLTYSPLLYWRLNDTTGAVATDSSGNGRDGAYINTPTLGNVSLLADGDGTSIYFDRGNGSKAGLSPAAWMNVSQMTVTCTYLCSDEATGLYMFAARYHDNSGDYAWWLYRENREFKFGYKSTGGQVTVISSGVTEEQGQIYFIAAYCGAAGAGIRVYSLGQLLGSATGAAYALASSNGNFSVAGADVNDYNMDGALQEVSYFGSILAAGDLDALAAQAIAPQPQWLNRTTGVAARNGTSSHTLTFPATSAGSFLVTVVGGSVTSTATTPGWTKRLNPIDQSEYAVFTRSASAGETSLQLTHNGSNYPINYAVYEFPAGTSWVAGAGVSNGHAPNLTGLPGTPVTVFAGFGTSSTSPGDPIISTTWGWCWFEDIDVMTLGNGTTDGVYTTLGWRRGVTATSVSPSTGGVFGPVYTVPVVDRTSVTFALSIP